MKQYLDVLFMIFSKSFSYALRILMFMALKPEEIYSAQYLYENLHIHNRYLRRIMTRLGKSGFVKSVRGIKGGIVFQLPIDQIFLSDIIDQFEGMETFDGCIMGVADCKVSPRCTMHLLWDETKQKMLETFSKTSLKMLLNNPELASRPNLKSL